MRKCLHFVHRCFHAIAAELSHCDRGCTTHKPKIFTIRPFTEKVCQSLNLRLRGVISLVLVRTKWEGTASRCSIHAAKAAGITGLSGAGIAHGETEAGGSDQQGWGGTASIW